MNPMIHTRCQTAAHTEGVFALADRIESTDVQAEDIKEGVSLLCRSLQEMVTAAYRFRVLGCMSDTDGHNFMKMCERLDGKIHKLNKDIFKRTKAKPATYVATQTAAAKF